MEELNKVFKVLGKFKDLEPLITRTKSINLEGDGDLFVTLSRGSVSA